MISEVVLVIIAVDFDGTLCEPCFPEIGTPNKELIQYLTNRKEVGDRLILWTCREEKLLENAVEWCSNFGLFFDALNDNLEEIKNEYQHNSRKITADIYIDDRSMKPWDVMN